MKALGVGLWQVQAPRRRGRAPPSGAPTIALYGKAPSWPTSAASLVAPLAHAHRHHGDGRGRRARLTTRCCTVLTPARWPRPTGARSRRARRSRCSWSGPAGRWRGPCGGASAAPTARGSSSCAGRATTAATGSSRRACCGAGACASTCSRSRTASTAQRCERALRRADAARRRHVRHRLPRRARGRRRVGRRRDGRGAGVRASRSTSRRGSTASTGAVAATPSARSHTVCFAALKPGLLFEPGRAPRGRGHVADIGIDLGVDPTARALAGRARGRRRRRLAAGPRAEARTSGSRACSSSAARAG